MINIYYLPIIFSSTSWIKFFGIWLVDVLYLILLTPNIRIVLKNKWSRQFVISYVILGFSFLLSVVINQISNIQAYSFLLAYLYVLFPTFINNFSLFASFLRKLIYFLNFGTFFSLFLYLLFGSSVLFSTDHMRPTFLFDNPNQLAIHLALIFYLYSIISLKFNHVLFLFTLSSIFLTGSDGVFLIFLISFISRLSNLKSLKLISIFIFLLFLTLSFVDFRFNVFDSIRSLDFIRLLGHSRIIQYQSFMEWFNSDLITLLFGLGSMNFANYVSSINPSSGEFHSHSLFITIFAEYGIIFGLLFVFYFFSLFIYIAITTLSPIFLAIYILSLYSFFFPPLYINPLDFVFYI